MNAERVIVAATVAVCAAIGVAVALPSGSDHAAMRIETGTTVTQQSDDSTSAPVASSSDRVLRIYVVGDSYTGGSDMGGNGFANWTKIAQLDLRERGIRATFKVDAVGGTGYVNGAVDGDSFPDRIAETAPSAADIVLVFGSRNDMNWPSEQIDSAVDSLVATARVRSPNATIVLVGPSWVSENLTPEIVRVRDALASAAEADGVEFVDPIADEWFFGAQSELIGEDGVHPTDEGHVYMGGKMADIIEQVAQQRTR